MERSLGGGLGWDFGNQSGLVGAGKVTSRGPVGPQWIRDTEVHAVRGTLCKTPCPSLWEHHIILGAFTIRNGVLSQGTGTPRGRQTPMVKIQRAFYCSKKVKVSSVAFCRGTCRSVHIGHLCVSLKWRLWVSGSVVGSSEMLCCHQAPKGGRCCRFQSTSGAARSSKSSGPSAPEPKGLGRPSVVVLSEAGRFQLRGTLPITLGEPHSYSDHLFPCPSQKR